jgi:hypothetical protein
MPPMARISRPLLVLWTVAIVLLLAGVVVRSLDGAASASGLASASVEGFGSASPGGGVGPQEETGARRQAEEARGLGSLRADVDVPLHQRLLSVLGLVVMLVLAWLLSIDRRVVQWRVVLWGMGLQLLFALFILKTPLGVAIFAGLNDVVLALLQFTNEGASFLFGNLVQRTVPVTSPEGTLGLVAETGASFAFSVLPTIIFFSSLMTVLYHLGIMQAAVRGMAWVMMRTMRTSGAETLSAAGNIFVGQTEAPLLIKPFIERMTMSELMAVMTGASPRWPAA